MRSFQRSIVIRLLTHIIIVADSAWIRVCKQTHTVDVYRSPPRTARLGVYMGLRGVYKGLGRAQRRMGRAYLGLGRACMGLGRAHLGLGPSAAILPEHSV